MVLEGTFVSAWILLRGLTREKRHWGDFPEILRRSCGGVQIHAIDLPGNGGLNTQESPLQVTAMADSCRRQLTVQGISPPYFILAMSLGAMVAVTWVTRNPEEIEGCVLINTSLRSFNPFYHRLRPRSYPALVSLLLPWHSHHSRESIILRITSNRPIRADTLAEWAGYANQNPVSPRNALRQLFAAASCRSPSAKPQSPILILSSAQDQLVDPRCSRVLAAKWNSSFAEHPTAGHDLPLDDAAWVAERIRCWVDELVTKQ
jgi:pimeloyl-ACP methyl ester carboxylesterase